MGISENIQKIKSEIPVEVTLVAVSKTKPISDILKAYDSGQRIFGENKVQELTEKHTKLPKDIQWHMIGHLQTNKVKYIAPFVNLIHALDSEKLLKEIDKRAKQHDRKIDCLLQVHIAKEEHKFGIVPSEVSKFIENSEKYKNVNIIGLMGMATFTSDKVQIESEFTELNTLFSNFDKLKVLSMGMSGDYKIAIESGSTMVRVGSNIFGNRNY
ncbi:MAG: YggS family pyridoxal phosphate-dependent enzyme [Flavobacteriales bacterium]|nr:YggS family pyridoxal phosphate-dependent enzyme [Flavobacteriales bacterium]